MLDNEVKVILQDQFSKERNYQKVLNKVNSRQIANKKILKFALLPTCAIILATIIILNIDNNNSDYKIAYTNNITEENIQNTQVEIADTNELVEKNITEVKIENENKNNVNNIDDKETTKNNVNNIDEKEITKNDNTTIKVAESKIYKTIQGGESNWAYDPTIPTNLIKDNTESKYVIKVKITSVGEGEMLPKQENFYNPFTCHTPIKMQIIDNLLNDNKISGTIKAYITGGKIKIANILKGTKQEIEYMGIYDASQVNPEQYIEYKWSVPYYEPNVGDEYVIIINKTNENLYQIYCGGYGIFKVEKTNNHERYINVITNKEWKI